MTHFDSHHLVNPIVQAEPADTLAHCSDCLAYLTESASVVGKGELSPTAFMGLQMLLDCVRSAIDYEGERLSKDSESTGSRKEKLM